MNELLSEALSKVNIAIFCIVILIVGIAVYEDKMPLDAGFLIAVAAAVLCGFIATLMVIKEQLEEIRYRLTGSNNITRAIHVAITENDD